ncbi:type I-F CRISPR-associated protein Csy1 [Selenomonas ruminantium]|uniref:HNH endonuclease n=1 Tax=Selenomonas ruminantium TaxID=971 RepID=A0A1K1NYH3_SELRU|nr:type I-F CRISPR-associated protein Csy1 [Selenomonas ruminantium]SFW40253.1 HNH endonuclease [Selenomonas ruminantium]
MLRKQMLAVIKGTMPEDEKIAKYMEGLLQAIDKNCLATHVAKFTETNSPGNIGVYDDSQGDLSCGYLCTANSGWHDFDMVTNDAKYKRPHGFIAMEMQDGRTVMEHLQEDSAELRQEMEQLTDKYDEIRKGILNMAKIQPDKTNQFIKQVFFPVGESYHLLSVLPSTVLNYEVGTRLFKSRLPQIRLKLLTDKAASTTGSRLVSKNKWPIVFQALPPKFLEKSLAKALDKEFLLPDIDVDEMSGVEAGCLLDSSLLTVIIEEGKRKGEGNYRPSYLRDERKEETVQAFLAKYGYDGIPIGYEIHHIVPLSQGGDDSIRNMIMLSIEDHAKVTEAHAAYFKWR